MNQRKVYTVAFAGNPNVGKSTLFNQLTGMNQHTGNWTGKTVENAIGTYFYSENEFRLVDLPGTYSIMANSEEERVARDMICFGTEEDPRQPDVTVVVIDGTNIEHGLNLALQTLEISERLVLCVNLLDEAHKKGIKIDLNLLSTLLEVPVVGTQARKGIGLEELKKAVLEEINRNVVVNKQRVFYPEEVERAAEETVERGLAEIGKEVGTHWSAMRLLEGNISFVTSLCCRCHALIPQEITLEEIRQKHGFAKAEDFSAAVVNSIVQKAEEIAAKCVENTKIRRSVSTIDRIITSRLFGIPLMCLLFAGILWITIVGANYPSSLLSQALFGLEERLDQWLTCLSFPTFLTGLFIHGMYRTVAWVIAVMLPPMAIFFPLFTILEDLGLLPRVAFNLDRPMHKASISGKNALTMCMGLGCNACGVTGCRIIQSRREHLIGIVTNNFMPCNGRFPTIITLISLFFVASFPVYLQSVCSAAMLLAVIGLGVVLTLLASFVLSKTVFRGCSSSFILELPPYRKPQFVSILVRSLLDRTLFVLGRAITVAAPAGLLIWLLANISIGTVPLLGHISGFLEPAGRLFGMDGVILMAFLLGFPANEIVLPIILMSYLSTDTMIELTDQSALLTILGNNGWTITTAVCFILFSLSHFPCGTTCQTIYKETKSVKITLLSVFLPTAIGLSLCFVANFVASIF